MKQLYLLICLLILTSINLRSQTERHTFVVDFKGDHIGTMHAKRIVHGNTSYYDLTTNTNVEFFAFSVHIESEVELFKKAGVMQSSKCYKESSRKSQNMHAHIEKADDLESYHLFNEGEAMHVIEKTSIRHCVLDLYFKEPINVSRVFSNMQAKYLPVKKLKEHVYEVTMPDGHKTTYYYKDQQLIRVVLETTFGDVNCKRES